MAILIFDLDGTLIDTTHLVLPAYRKALGEVGANPIPSEEAMARTFGLPEQQIWETLLPDSTEEQRKTAWRLTTGFIESDMGRVHILLPHAIEVLEELRARGHVLTIASNCEQRYLDAVLDVQDIRSFFAHPLCLGTVRGRKKADILSAHFQVFRREESVMIGDRSTDIEAAHEHGIPVVGCQFGFGDDAELAGADVLIHELRELLPLFPPAGASTLFFPHGRR